MTMISQPPNTALPNSVADVAEPGAPASTPESAPVSGLDAAVAKITNDKENGRYVAFNAGGDEMGWLGYRKEKGALVIWTTRTQPEFRGKGVADALTRYAVDKAVAKEMPISPVCWYASEWMHRNPKYLKYVTDPGF